MINDLLLISPQLRSFSNRAIQYFPFPKRFPNFPPPSPPLAQSTGGAGRARSIKMAREGELMRRWKWGKAALIALGLVGTAMAQQPTPGDPAKIVVIREAGKPEQRCVIEYTIPQADGKTVYYVRDVATGERLRVLDSGANKAARGPIVGQVMGRLNTPSDSGMSKALESAP